jgi:hypothetical protein
MMKCLLKKINLTKSYDGAWSRKKEEIVNMTTKKGKDCWKINIKL